MLKSVLLSCGKTVQSLRTAVGTNSAYSSTGSEYNLVTHTRLWLSSRFTLRFIPDFYPPLSTLKIAISPPIEQDFYPLSTTPTIRATKKKEERN